MLKLSNDIRAHLKTTFKQTPTSSIHASNLGRCIRYQVWDLKGRVQHCPKDILRRARAFEFGSAIHERFQSWLKVVYPTAVFEHRIQNELGIVGKIDAIINDEILEIKTASSRSYQEISNNPTDNHYFKKQLHTYSWMMDLEGCNLIVINLDSKTWKEFWIPIDWECVGDIIEEVTSIRNFLDSNIDPPMIETCTESNSNWCPYQSTCYSESVERSNSVIND